MGCEVYEDRAARDHGVERWAGYGVPAICDMPDCDAEIDRGMGYRCETVTEYVYYRDGRVVSAYQDWDEEIEVETEGCGLHFCGEHLYDHDAHESATPKPDVPAWEHHMLTDESWAQWRAENPDRVATMRSRATTIAEAKRSPDCREGKHRACTGDAWDDALDEGCDCECRCHERTHS